MDKRDNLDFEEFEKKLKQLPKVEDLRSKEVIYQNIKEQINAQPAKRRRKWIVPAIASTAAALLLILLTPMLLSHESEEALPGAEEAEVNEMFAIEVEEASDTAEQDQYIPAFVDHILQENQRVVTVPFVDQQANFVVPVSFIVRNDESILRQMTSIVEEYNPANVGLSASPLMGVIMEEVSDATIAVNIPEVPIGSANETMLVESIMIALRPLAYSYVNVLVAGEEGVDIGQFGPMERYPINTFPSTYFFYKTPNGVKLLVKGIQEDIGEFNFEQILQQMKDANQQMGLYPTIPEEVMIESVEEEKAGVVTVTFSKDTDLSTVSNGLMMIEAILLAARDSGIEEIRFVNTGVDEWGPYSFSGLVSTNIYPNGVAYHN